MAILRSGLTHEVIKVSLLAWFSNRTFSIFNSITDTRTIPLWTYPKLTNITRVQFLDKRDCCGELNISDKVNAQRTIVKSYLRNIFKFKRIIFCQEFCCTLHLTQFDLEPKHFMILYYSSAEFPDNGDKYFARDNFPQIVDFHELFCHERFQSGKEIRGRKFGEQESFWFRNHKFHAWSRNKDRMNSSNNH